MVLDGLDGVEVIADDIMVYGVDENEKKARVDHDRKREKRVKINKEKMKMNLTELKHMGHATTTEGVKAYPAKVQGLKDMPRDTSEVKRFYGLESKIEKVAPGQPPLADQ